VSFVISGLVTGAAYGILAVGLVLVFRSTGVLNFAHGSIGALGAYFFVTLSGPRANQTTGLKSRAGLPVGIGLLISLVAAAAFGALLYRAVLHRVTRHSALAATIVTIVMVGLLESAIASIWSNDPQFVPLLFPGGTVKLGGTIVTYAQIGTVAVALLGAGALALWLKRSTLGLALRALSDNPEGLQVLGVNPVTLGVFTWSLAAVVASLAAILLAPTLLLLPGTVQAPLGKAFGAALIGGLRNAPIALLGGLGIGVVEGVLAANLESVGMRDAIAFFMILVLLFALRRQILGTFAFTEGEARA